MGALSFFITLASVAVAVVMAILAARVLRHERLRSDARVEALARMAGVSDSAPVSGLADFLPEPDADYSAGEPVTGAEGAAALFASFTATRPECRNSAPARQPFSGRQASSKAVKEVAMPGMRLPAGMTRLGAVHGVPVHSAKLSR